MVSGGIGERMVFVLISIKKFVNGLTILNKLISLPVWHFLIGLFVFLAERECYKGSVWEDLHIQGSQLYV